MDEKITKILKNFPNIKFALIFGSYAKNEQRFLSDIDVAIYLDSDIDLFMQGEMIAELESEFDKKIDLVVLNGLYKKNPKLSFNIIDNHKLLFCEDMDEYFEFKAKTFKYYFDSKYIYDMFDKSLSKRLKNGTFGKIKAS